MFPSLSRRTEAALIGVILVSAGCGPSPTTGGSCRTYATAATQTLTSNGAVVGTGTLTWSYNRSTHVITQILLQPGQCTTYITTVKSTAEFVDQVRVIPPAAGVPGPFQTTSGPTCGAPTFTFAASPTFANGRLQRIDNSVNGQYTSTQTMTAWDNFDRPISATTNNGSSSTWSYDAVARATRDTTTDSAGTVISDTTYDSRGIVISVVINNPFGAIVVTKFDITATDVVCK